jgi:ABC-type branched-subunit amino acid transport system ATPase component
MAELVLDSLEIKGFRAFDQLTVERLGRVNLIVGKNNVGKTALLEAVRMYARQDLLERITDAAHLRATEAAKETTEGGPVWGNLTDAELRTQYETFRHLFHGHPSARDLPVEFKIGPMGQSEGVLCVGFAEKKSGKVGAVGPHFRIQIGGEREASEKKRYYYLKQGANGAPSDSSPALFVPHDGLGEQEARRMWNDVFLEGKKEVVVEALRTVEPNVQDVDWVSAPQMRLSFHGAEALADLSETGKRLPFVEVESQKRPLPLESMGEGMSRLLSIGIALANAEDGLLLVDEIENGLHYSTQPDLWRLIFETAARLNVQVFAATHSMDCIRAFQHAADEHPNEGMLVSLRRKREAKEEIVAVLADEADLETVVSTGIEVR